jgi:hypothetical protein
MNLPTIDNEQPDVVVDVSNLCFEDRLGSKAAVDLFRVRRIAEAWQSQRGRSTFAFIADRSLGSYHLPPVQRPLYRTLVSSKRFIEVDYADPVFLELADAAGAAVLSNDGFKDFRRDHRWLEATGRCFGWTVSGDTVQIHDRDLGRLLPADESLHIERKERGAHPYFCDRCGWGPPVDSVECGGCGRDRIEVAPVEGAVGIVVETPVEGLDVRFVLGPGDDLTIGRATPGLSTAEIGDAAATLSRQHLLVRNTGRGTHVRDISSNGTDLFKWYPGGRDGEPGYEARDPLPDDVWTPFGRSDLALIGDGVAVRISGRSDPWGRWLRRDR